MNHQRLVSGFIAFALVGALLASFTANTPSLTSVGISHIKAANPGDAIPAAEITSLAITHSMNMLRRAYDESIAQQEVSKYVESVMRLEGADTRLSFCTLTMSGSELTQGHGNPYDDATHIIDPDTEPVVMIDAGCRVNGHCSDVTRTFFFDGVSQEILDAYEAVLACEEAILAEIRAGVTIGDLDDIHNEYLADYIGQPGISVLYYWGHALGDYVHEFPYLSRDAADEILLPGQVLAVEPGIYSEDGWAVRVEDTVIVTEFGVTVLSDAPKELEDVMIHEDRPSLSGTSQWVNCEYGSTSTLTLLLFDSIERFATQVEFHDGKDWHVMEELDHNIFSYSYFLGYSYHGITTVAFRVSIGEDLVYLLEEKNLLPDGATSHSIDPSVHVSFSGSGVSTPLMWTFDHDGASMIRVYFDSMVSPVWDQFAILDSNGDAVIEYKCVDRRGFWSPWVSGDALTVIAYPTEPSVMDPFSFDIETYETLSGDPTEPVATSTSTTTTSNTTSIWTGTTTTSSTGPPLEIDLGVFIAGSAALLFLGIVALIARDLRT